MKSIGGREIFFSETFILPEGESALFDSAPRGFPLAIEVNATTVAGGAAAQAHIAIIPATLQMLQAGAGPKVVIRLENWESTIPALFLKPVKFGQLADGTALSYNIAVTSIRQ